MSAKFRVPVGKNGVVELDEDDGRRVHKFMQQNGARFATKEVLDAFIRRKCAPVEQDLIKFGSPQALAMA